MYALIAFVFCITSCFGREIAVDNYHGVRVEDPYRFLEDPHSEETKAWIEMQNSRTRSYFDEISEREAIRNRLQLLYNYQRNGFFFERGGRYFFSKNDGLQNQDTLYTMDRIDGDPEVLFDPNLLSSDGTVSVNSISVSPNGHFAALVLSKAGSDWSEVIVQDVETKETLSDHLQWLKLSPVSWLHDSSGFYYGRYDAPSAEHEYQEINKNHKIYFHRLGTKQEEDLLIYARPDQPQWRFMAEVTEDGRYLILYCIDGCSPYNGICYKDLSSDGPVRELFSAFDAYYEPLGNIGSKFWVLTGLKAPQNRVIALDLNSPDQIEEVIGEKREKLSSVNLVGDRLFATYLKDAHHEVQIYHLDGRFEKTLSLPSIGTVGGFSGERTSRQTFYGFMSFTQPYTLYRYDFATQTSSIVFQPSYPISCEDYETTQVFYKSKDGTQIPLFLSYKKGIEFDGSNRTLLYGYGGFGCSLTPSFSSAYMAWMERGGVVAIPSLRGGGEYGQPWHDAGRLANKQNVFDDFIAAAEWLVSHNITSPSKLAIFGGSNGGLLVGACLTQRPELFGAALIAVGVLDMLRFHQFTIGYGWITEYGSPDDPMMFPYLYKYSPLHNIRAGVVYPPVLILTADHDDRVVPAHSYKFTAALQDATPTPVVLRVETSAGHGAGKPISKTIDETADRMAFLLYNLK